MQINLSRKLSDSSLISHVSNDREEIDKYNNRTPIKKISNLPEETATELKSDEKSMDSLIDKKLPLSKDYKTSNFFTGFHHKAYLENVQIAQSKSKSNYRSRSTSPALPPIPYTKKPPQNLSPSSKISRSPRPRFMRELPQTHKSGNAKEMFSNRTLVSRSTSPINIQSVEANEPRSTLTDFPNEVPSNKSEEKLKFFENEEENPTTKYDAPKQTFSQNEFIRFESEENPTGKEDDPEEIFHMDQLTSESTTRDETVTPSKILRHFQFKHNETKGIPKDIPEKLLNKSQRSNFDQAFREIVQSGKGPRFEDGSQIRNKNEELLRAGQRHSKTFQEEVQRKNENSEINPLLIQIGDKFEDTLQDVCKEIPKGFCSNQEFRYGEGYQKRNHKENDISEAILKQNMHDCRKCKYNQNCQKGDGYSEEISQFGYGSFGDGTEGRGFASIQQRSKFNNGNGSTKQMHLLDNGCGTRSDDGFHKKVYQNSRRSLNLKPRFISGEIFKNENAISPKLQDQRNGFKLNRPLQEKFRATSEETFDFVEDNTRRKFSQNGKSSQTLNTQQDGNGLKEDSDIFNNNHGTHRGSHHQVRKNTNHIKRSPNEISQLLYYNYGQCTFNNGKNITATISQGSFETKTRKTSSVMEETTKPIEEQTLISNLLENLDLDHEISNQLEPEDNHKNNLNQNNLDPKFDHNVQSETWRFYQRTSADMLNNSNDVLEAHHKVSSTTISFNSPKRPSSVPPLKRRQKKYQNPREIELVNTNHGFEDKPLKGNQGKRSLIESIKNKVFPSARLLSRDKEELKTWDEPENHRESLKFPKETKNAVMLMLNGTKSKVTWKNDERHHASLRQARQQTTCTKSKANLSKSRTQLPCPKNLLCEKGLHSGKCRKSERGMMMKISKHCVCNCKDRRVWCSECQNVWPGSAKRCDEISSEETQPDDAFLQIMEPHRPQKSSKVGKCVLRKNFNQQDPRKLTKERNLDT